MRLFVSNFLMFLLFLLMLIQPVEASEYSKFANDTEVCTVAAQQFEKKYQIKKHLLSTITNVESGRWNEQRQKNTPWPWTVNAQGKGRFFETKQQAIAEVKRLQAEGVRSIDVGCMQINLAYHPEAFDDLEEAFNPYKNMDYAARFLKKLYVQNGNDWNKAATAYHSTQPQKAQKYAQKLSKAYKGIVQAHLDTKTVNKNLTKTKKLEKDKLLAKNKRRIEANNAQISAVWREDSLFDEADTSKKAKSSRARITGIWKKEQPPRIVNTFKKTNSLQTASAWREAKLAEYQLRKANQL